MKKVAIFTEGQGELIFVRQLILELFDPSDISFDCYELRGSFALIPFPYKFASPTAKTHFQIINVGNDVRVLNEILDRQEKLIELGYEILGIRDMYSMPYTKLSQEISSSINELFITMTDERIKGTGNADRIHIFFAIMELEAWFLSMHHLLGKISPILTSEFINSKLGFDLATIDPEITFFHPAKKVDQIFRLIGKEYRKSAAEMESIASHMDDGGILAVTESTKCKSFTAFVNKMIEVGQ